MRLSRRAIRTAVIVLVLVTTLLLWLQSTWLQETWTPNLAGEAEEPRTRVVGVGGFLRHNHILLSPAELAADPETVTNTWIPVLQTAPIFVSLSLS